MTEPSKDGHVWNSAKEVPFNSEINDSEDDLEDNVAQLNLPNEELSEQFYEAVIIAYEKKEGVFYTYEELVWL